MTRNHTRRTLRNERVGDAYMMMLAVYQQCREQGLPEDQILIEIQRAKKTQLDDAWDVALRELASDFGLPMPARKERRDS